MMILGFVVAGFMARATIAGTMAVKHHHCATRDLSAEEQNVWNQASVQDDHGRNIELDAAFHFCCVSESDCPSDEIAKKEIKLLNECYAPAQISFKLKNTTRLIEAACSQTDVTDQATMDNYKSRTHQGDTSTLNIVYLPTNEGNGAKGYCVIPPNSDNIRGIFGRRDGCVVATSTLPGLSRWGGDKDVTSAHEAGHWLGLQHWNDNYNNNNNNNNNNNGGRFFRRQRGGSRNIMVPYQVTGAGIKYEFDQSQIPNLRQMAMRRKNQGGSRND